MKIIPQMFSINLNKSMSNETLNFRWRKFSHLEPSYLYSPTVAPSPSLESLAPVSAFTSRANSQDRYRQSSILSNYYQDYLPQLSQSESRRQSTAPSTTSTSRRLSLCQVTEHLINTSRRKSCLPESLARQKSAPCTIEEGRETPVQWK